MNYRIITVAVVILVVPTVCYWFLRVKANTSISASPLEDAWIVSELDGKITCVDPEGNKSIVQWSDLRSIQIETNDRGPAEPDVFWILKDSESTCRFPQGARGEKDLRKKIISQPSFDLKLFIDEVVSSTKNRIFDLWARETD